MKHVGITFFMMALMLTSFAQKPSLSRAYNYYYDRDFVKAKEAIDLCFDDEKLQNKATTWIYKANIYHLLANQEYGERQKNEAYQIRFPNSPLEAFDAYIKAKELNKNVMATDMMSPDEGLPQLYTLLFIYGVDEIIAERYESASNILEKGIASYEMKTPPPYSLHGEIYYYYAYTLEMKGDLEKARVNYEKAIKDSSNNVNVYLRLIENYKNENQPGKILEIIQMGKNIMPGNPDLIVAEADYYFRNNDKATGNRILSSLPVESFNDINTIVNIANLYILDSNYLEAEKLLRKSYRLNPDNFVILYNLGVCCYYISQDYFLTANELDVKGRKADAQPLKEKSDTYLLEARDFFEKALNFQPEDLSVLNILKAIYARLDSPKYDEIIKKIENIKATE